MWPWGKRQRPIQPTHPLLYELVELRRQQFDGLIWQVPALTFTGQAFIFTVLLAPDTRWWARIFAGILSVGISFLALLLIARHRQAEEMTSRWLSKREEQWPSGDRQHGSEWQTQRNRILPGLPEDEGTEAYDAGRRTGWGRVPLANGYKTWVVALWLLILITTAVTAIGVVADFHDPVVAKTQAPYPAPSGTQAPSLSVPTPEPPSSPAPAPTPTRTQ